MSAVADSQGAEKELLKVCHELELETFTDETFFSYIETLNRESNAVFDYATYKKGYFANKDYLRK